MPVSSDEQHIPGEGHAHLYVNGKKTIRLYSQWYHINNLPSGSYEFTILLTSNDHRVYTDKTNVISDTLHLNVD